MCRWLVYASAEPIVLADLVLNAQHSIVHQSFSGGRHPRCSAANNMPLNADGFGLGWYHGCGRAAIFRSITPAWSNRNLRELAGAVTSRCCFAHIRAATPGSVVSEENAHPFRFGRLLFQHNGHIEGFDRVKRRIIDRLPDEIFSWIDGSTDSEHCFALLLAQLRDPARCAAFDVAELEYALLRTLAILRDLGDAAAVVDGFSTCNFALTDGESVVITRYCDKSPKIPPPSLYYAFRNASDLRAALNADAAAAASSSRPAYGVEGAAPAPAPASCPGCPVRGAPGPAQEKGHAGTAFLCASEPLDASGNWTLVEENCILSFSLSAQTLLKASLEEKPSPDAAYRKRTPTRAITPDVLAFAAKLDTAESWRRKYLAKCGPNATPPASPSSTYTAGVDGGDLARRAAELGVARLRSGGGRAFELRTRSLSNASCSDLASTNSVDDS